MLSDSVRSQKAARGAKEKERERLSPGLWATLAIHEEARDLTTLPRRVMTDIFPVHQLTDSKNESGDKKQA